MRCDTRSLADGSRDRERFFLFVCTQDNYAINHFTYYNFFFFFSSISFSDLQFPIDLSGVEKDHPFLQKDQLQSLYRRLLVLNRSAAMRLDGQYNRNINVCRNFMFSFSFRLTRSNRTRSYSKSSDISTTISIFLTTLRIEPTRFSSSFPLSGIVESIIIVDHPRERFFHSTQFSNIRLLTIASIVCARLNIVSM